MSNGLAKIALSLDDIPIHLPLAPAKYQDTDKTSSTHAVLFHLGKEDAVILRGANVN